MQDRPTSDDYGNEITAISEFTQATWNLRDVLLARHGLTPEVVQLEDAALRLGEALATLRAATQRQP